MASWLRRRGFPLLVFTAGLLFVYRQALQGNVYFGRDALRFFIPDSSFLLESLRRGELPLWTPYIRLGQPFLATLQSQVFYPPRVLTVALFGPIVGYTVQQVLHAALATAGTYWAARKLGARRLGATLAGVAFGLSPMLTDLAGQRNVVDAAAWSGVIVATALQLRRRWSLRGAGLFGVSVAMSIACGAPETLLWQGLIVLGLLVRRPKSLLASLGGGVWAVGAMAVVLVPAVEFVRHSTRGSGAEGALQWSASWAQLVGVFWPLAEHPRGAYWDGPDQWFVLTVFVGTAVVAIAAGAGLRRDARPLWILLGVFALLAAGKHFPPAATLLQLPPFSLFRYPGKYLVAVAFVLSLLTAVGLGRWGARARRSAASPRRAVLALALGLGAFAGGVPLLRLLGARAGAQGGWLWLCGVLLLGGLVFLLAPGEPPPTGPKLPRATGLPAMPVFRKDSLRARRVMGAFAAIALAELVAFHLLQLRSGWAPPGPLGEPSSLAAALPTGFAGRISTGGLGQGDPFAVAPGAEPTHRLSRDALLGNRFVEERLHSVEGGWVPEMRGVEALQLSGERAVYDLVATDYYVRETRPFADLEPVAEAGPRTLFRSRTAMPRAFIVHRAEVLPDDAALARVLDPAQPARHTAFLAEGSPLEQQACSGFTPASILSESSNRVRVYAKADCEGFLVLSDTWYPGWRVRVDGAPAPLLRADFLLRAVRLSAGTHEVLFEYRPASFFWGAGVSAFAWFALGLALYLQRRRVQMS